MEMIREPIHSSSWRIRGSSVALGSAVWLASLGTALAAEVVEEIQITATRRAEASFEVPPATTVIDRDELRALAPQTVMDALHGEPGTFVQQTTPGQGIVIVRGLKGSEVLHLVDGFRLNNAIFRNSPNQYIALVDAQMLDRIEVVRGPMAALYGGDAMGGVVQMRSAEPAFSEGAWEPSARLRTFYGSADRSLVTRAEGAIAGSALVLSGGSTLQDVEDLRTGGTRVPSTDFRSRSGDVKLRARAGDRHELMLSAQQLEQPETPRVDELVAGFGQTQPASSVALFDPQKRTFYHARYRYAAELPWLDELSVHWGKQRIDDGRRSRAFGSNVEERENIVDTTRGVQLDLRSSLGDSHRLAWGAEYYSDEVRASRAASTNGGPRVARAPRFPDGSSLRQFSAFAADDWSISRRFELSYGVRYSAVKSLLPTQSGLGNRDLSGNVSLTYAPRASLRIVASVGRGFRAPNVFDLGTFGDRPGNRFNIPNPELKPETVLTADLGLKHSSDRLQAELNVFHSDYDDKITSLETGAVTSNGRRVTQSRNVASVKLWGIESGARYRLTDSTELYATATFTRGKEKVAGSTNHAERVPPLFGKAGVRWSKDRLSLEGYSFYAASQRRLNPRDRVDPRIDPDGTPSWVTLNFKATWQATDRLGVGLRLENLGDRRYREHASGLDEPGFNAIASFEWTL
jgi:TonB-dependent heme/hemoglobin receptor